MDISIALNHLGLNANSYRLTQSVPPHSIVEWNGPAPQPTEAELQAAYDVAIVEEEARRVRDERNRLLSESDWTQLADAPVDGAIWASYRQSLRDLPQQEGFPWSVEWPSLPMEND